MNRCKICDNAQRNKVHKVRETMFDLGDEFGYLECAQCGCIQLMSVPEDMGRYYPAGYYSFADSTSRTFGLWRRVARRQKHLYCLYGKNPVGWLLRMIGGYPPHFVWLREAGLKFDSAILDLGCGAGGFLNVLKRDGFANVTGADPFIENDIFYDNGVVVRKQTLSEINKQYDFVIMNHAFEHIPDPLATLRQLWGVLKPNRYALIRIPIAPCFAWQKYGANWVQLDAPRHLFIHTISSMKTLAEAANLTITKIFFDSDHFQFTGSEKNVRGISRSQPDEAVFSRNELAVFRRDADKLNREGKGDQAGFYLYKPADSSPPIDLQSAARRKLEVA